MFLLKSAVYLLHMIPGKYVFVFTFMLCSTCCVFGYKKSEYFFGVQPNWTNR